MDFNDFINEWNAPSPLMLVHTSGSTGKPKPLLVEKKRMAASAANTCRFLGLESGDTALLCMSLDYIAGKMMAVRAIVWGLDLLCVEPSGHPLAGVKGQIGLAAMIPMQVFNSLQVAEEREQLSRINHLLIGGGAIDESMEATLRSFPNAIWATYGMTETLSHIALRRINGQNASQWFTPFDDVNIKLDGDGCLVIDAPTVCESTLHTNDIAEIAQDGRHFRIIGRKDNVICSGGIKMQIEEMEKTVKPEMLSPFLITKKKDPKFGEIVVLLTEDDDLERAKQACEKALPKYQHPKLYIHVERIPITQTGKPARAEAMKVASEKA